MSGRAILRVALVVFVALMVQQTVMVALRIGGAHPDILWLLPITAALLDGPETGAIVGFWSGLAFDLVLPTPFGLSALVGCLLGFTVGVLSAPVDPRATWLKPVAALDRERCSGHAVRRVGRGPRAGTDGAGGFPGRGRRGDHLEPGARAPGQPSHAMGAGRRG